MCEHRGNRQSCVIESKVCVIDYKMPMAATESKGDTSTDKIFRFFSCVIQKKRIFAAAIRQMSNGVMAAQLTLDQLV